MRASLALLVLVVTWTVVAARAGPTGTGEPGETLPCTCVPTCTVYMYSYMHVQLHACTGTYTCSTFTITEEVRQHHMRPL